ncbi:hypothetical protein PT974_12554 [Cladobotryum mycophilum]|uniref:Uncharacterized protein n=1 Tax=Cladobotryum mycophilum TaxID=491253 RepID=A0ABR0S9F4_9HYPO
MAIYSQDLASRYDKIIIQADNIALSAYPRELARLNQYPTTQAIIDGALAAPAGLLNPGFSSLNLVSFSSMHTMVLFGEGCIGGWGEVNCTSSCGSPERLFMNWKTLWTCLTLASLYLNMPDPIKAPEASLQINEALRSLDMTNTTQFDAMGVLNHTYECAAANCGAPGDMKCSIMSRNGSDYLDWVSPISKVCWNVYAMIDPDIAGTGVMISYMTQLVLALYGWGWICVFTLTHLIEWTTASTRKLRLLRPFTARLSGYIFPIEQVTSTFLVDFQEAQCFFVLSIQIALLFAKSQTADFIGVDNWQSLVDTRTAVDLLASAGALPIVLTQIGLQKLGLDSIYTHLLCTTAVVFAFTSGVDPVDVSFKTVNRMFSGHDTLPECGMNTSLTTFCAMLDDGNTLNSSLFVVFAILALLWARKVWNRFLHAKVFNKKPGTFYERNIPIQNPATDKRWVRMLSLLLGPWLLLAAEVYLVTYIVIVFKRLMFSVFDDSIRGPNPNDWSVGQVISMLIWVPVVIKYLYLAIAGVEKGFRFRLSHAFVVVKKSNLPKVQFDESPEEIDDPEEMGDYFKEQKLDTKVPYKLIRRRSGTI